MAQKESVITPEVVAEMQAQAPLDYEKCGVIGEKFGIPQRSVVASATRQGIAYVKKARVSKTGAAVASKSDLVGVIASDLGVDLSSLDGLEKATKSALTAIVESFEIAAFRDSEDGEDVSES